MITERLLPDGLARAASLLCDGRLVAFATETVYGLGADATNDRAVASVFAAKGRPRFNPLICHYPGADAAFADVVACQRATALAAAFWPGPLTLVLPRRPANRVAALTSAGLDSIAVRVPAHPTAQALLAAVARPVAAPSANPSGQVSPTTAEHVLAGLSGRIDAVLDSGACPVGIESTVVDLTGAGARLLRPGRITREAIAGVIGGISTESEAMDAEAAMRSPGMLASHYRPRLPVRLQAVTVGADEALLAFGDALPGAGAVYNLSPIGDLIEAASRLFAGLHWLDGSGLSTIAVMDIPPHGIGEAILDRLSRAAVKG